LKEPRTGIIHDFKRNRMGAHQDVGKWGEMKACEYLQKKGFEVLSQNYRYQHAEIDIIAKQGNMLIFVEVKTRTGSGFGMPEEFVNYTKAKLILKAAENYIYSTNWSSDIRFDIISLLLFPDGQFNIRHIEDAFY
jgi:putative endonuclease